MGVASTIFKRYLDKIKKISFKEKRVDLGWLREMDFILFIVLGCLRHAPQQALEVAEILLDAGVSPNIIRKSHLSESKEALYPTLLDFVIIKKSEMPEELLVQLFTLLIKKRVNLELLQREQALFFFITLSFSSEEFIKENRAATFGKANTNRERQGMAAIINLLRPYARHLSDSDFVKHISAAADYE